MDADTRITCGNAPHYSNSLSDLIEAMMEQNISDEFTIEMDGLSHNLLLHALLMPPMESDGVIQAVALPKGLV